MEYTKKIEVTEGIQGKKKEGDVRGCGKKELSPIREKEKKGKNLGHKQAEQQQE